MPLYNLQTDKDKITSKMGKKFDGIPSGITALDNVISGVGKSELCIIGGRPGMGKSSLARDILLHNSKPDSKKGVSLFATMEMPAWMVCELMAATLANVNLDAIKRGYANPKMLEVFNKYSDEIFKFNMFIQDNSNLTPDVIRKDLLTIKESQPIACLIVDYLQLMSLHRPVESREREVATISRELKAIAMEFDIPVIALSQLSRKADYRESSVPKLTDLRETGALEQDPDKVILIHRPSYYIKQDNANAEDDGEAQLHICKQRGGKSGVVECAFIGEWTSFRDKPDEDFSEDF